MASIMRGVFNFGRYQWMAFIERGILCISICSISSVYSAEDVNCSPLEDKFNQFHKSADGCNDPLEEGRNFLDQFIKEINAQHGLNLTLLEACSLVKINLHVLQIAPELQEVLLATIQLLESGPVQKEAEQEKFEEIFENKSLYIDLSWAARLLNKKLDLLPKNEKKSQKKKYQPPICQVPSPSPKEMDLPSNCYVGACELLAGALLCILPIPGAPVLGLAMMGDGARRVMDGLVELGEERRKDPNFVSPQPPFYTDS